MDERCYRAGGGGGASWAAPAGDGQSGEGRRGGAWAAVSAPTRRVGVATPAGRRLGAHALWCAHRTATVRGTGGGGECGRWRCRPAGRLAGGCPCRRRDCRQPLRLAIPVAGESSLPLWQAVKRSLGAKLAAAAAAAAASAVAHGSRPHLPPPCVSPASSVALVCQTPLTAPPPRASAPPAAHFPVPPPPCPRPDRRSRHCHGAAVAAGRPVHRRPSRLCGGHLPLPPPPSLCAPASASASARPPASPPTRGPPPSSRRVLATSARGRPEETPHRVVCANSRCGGLPRAASARCFVGTGWDWGAPVAAASPCACAYTVRRGSTRGGPVDSRTR